MTRGTAAVAVHTVYYSMCLHHDAVRSHSNTKLVRFYMHGGPRGAQIVLEHM